MLYHEIGCADLAVAEHFTTASLRVSTRVALEKNGDDVLSLKSGDNA